MFDLLSDTFDVKPIRATTERSSRYHQWQSCRYTTVPFHFFSKLSKPVNEKRYSKRARFDLSIDLIECFFVEFLFVFK